MNRPKNDRLPNTPSVPHGPIASGSSTTSALAIAGKPPSIAAFAARHTSTAATIIIAPWIRSVYTEAMMPPVVQ